MWHLDHADTAAETSIVHATVDLPTVLFRIVDLDCLKVRRTIETTDCHQLPVDNCQTDLPIKRNTVHTHGQQCHCTVSQKVAIFRQALQIFSTELQQTVANFQFCLNYPKRVFSAQNFALLVNNFQKK